MREKVRSDSGFAMRRSLVMAGVAGLLLPTAQAQKNAPTPLLLDLQRKGERMRVNVATAAGYKAAAWMLRDIKAGNLVGWPSPELLVWAARLQKAMNEYHSYTVFEVTSGLRTHQTNRKIEGAAQHSLHLPDANNQFFAMDLKPIGASVDQLTSLASRTAIGGVGRYDSHLHLDVRTSPARW